VAFLFFRPYRSQDTVQDGNVYLVRTLACQCAPSTSVSLFLAHLDCQTSTELVDCVRRACCSSRWVERFDGVNRAAAVLLHGAVVSMHDVQAWVCISPK
jgi:hypothetical protein